MAETYRAPKAVLEEAEQLDSELALSIRAGNQLDLESVAQLRDQWQLPEGRSWAESICSKVAERAAIVEEPGEEEKPESMAEELIELIGNVISLYFLAQGDEHQSSEDHEETIPGDPQTESNSKENPMIEERKAAIAQAERITMTAEVRAVDTDGALRISGYAATFNQEASGLQFREVIAPGAFTRTLQSENPVFLLVNHDTEQLPLASTQSGTLRLTQDEIGLRMDGDLDPSNPRAQELASALKRGDVDKMSFAFTVAPGGEERSEGVRTLKDLDLYEVSVVTWPAYDSTTVGMRSEQAEDLTLRARAAKAKLQSLRLKNKR